MRTETGRNRRLCLGLTPSCRLKSSIKKTGASQCIVDYRCLVPGKVANGLPSFALGLAAELQRYTVLKVGLWLVSERNYYGSNLAVFGSVKRDPAITAWMNEHSGELGAIAQHWFDIMRQCGDDVSELLHDGHPTACIGDAAFAYVNAFKAHVNIGFFRGAELEDPTGLLEGTGKYMRHVKLRPDSDINATALVRLIESAYADMKQRLEAEQPRVSKESYRIL